MARQCVQKCADKLHVLGADGICRSCAEENQKTPFFDGFGCVACTGALGGTLFDGKNCVGECPGTSPYVDEHGLCRACVDAFPELQFWNGTGCQACPAERPYWDDKRGYDGATPECSASCLEDIPLEGTRCVPECGIHKISENGRCRCVDGFRIVNGECAPPESHVVSLTGAKCEFTCGPNEKAQDGKCTYKESSVRNEARSACVLRRECERLFLASDGVEVCLDAKTCATNLCLAVDERYCVDSCSYWYAAKSGEKRCLESCPSGNQLRADGYYTVCALVDESAPLWNWARCVPCSSASRTRVLWADGKCRTCAEVDETRPFLDGSVCVSKCPHNRPVPDEEGVCQPCPRRSVGKNGKCVSCADANPARPVWDEGSNSCRACEDTDGGAFWDGQRCVVACAEVANIKNVCLTCAQLAPDRPVWLGGRCVSCAEKSAETPLYENGACVACPLGEEWDAYSGACAEICAAGEMRVEGACVPADREHCPESYVFVGSECAECDSQLGLVKGGDACVCDPEKHLAASDGVCTACDSELLEYNAASACCMCRNGGVVSERDGALFCDVQCASGVFALENPAQCLESCPSDMVLQAEGGRRFCGRCAGYAYFDRASKTTSCVTYAQCVAAGMVPQVTRESGVVARICSESTAQTAFQMGGETISNVQSIAVSRAQRKYVLKDRRVLVSKYNYTDARNNGRSLEEGVVALGQYMDGVFALREDGTLMILGSALARETRVAGVASADGSDDFGAYVTTDGKFHCESPAGLCPESVPGPVHGIASANSFGLTIQLLSGALYYRRGVRGWKTRKRSLRAFWARNCTGSWMERCSRTVRQWRSGPRFW